MSALVEAVMLSGSLIAVYIKVHRAYMDGDGEPWPGMTRAEWNTAQPPF